MLDIAKNNVEKAICPLLEAGVLTEKSAADIRNRITYTVSMEEALNGTDFIQENGPEKLEIKRAILADVDRYAPANVIYASSTSGLKITDIAANSMHPERCVGAHPYNPPHLIPLVEIMKGEESNPEMVQLAYDFYQSVGKEAVLLHGECPGFISNRLQMAVYREMTDLVMRGVCSVKDVDKALVYGPGLRWGIFGHNMVLQLASPGCLTGFFQTAGAGCNALLADMADWKSMPDVIEKLQAGVNEEMKELPPFIGNSDEACREFRDHMLIQMLKMHKKF